MDALELDDEPAQALLELGRRVVSMLVVGIGGLVDGFLEPITALTEGGGLHPISHVVSEGGPRLDLTGLKGDEESPRAGDAPGTLKVLEIDTRLPDLGCVDIIEDGMKELWLVGGRGRGRRGAPAPASSCVRGRAGPSRPIVAATTPRVASGYLPVALAAAGASGDTTASRSAAVRSPGENGNLGRRGRRDLLGVCTENGLEGRHGRLRGLQLCL